MSSSDFMARVRAMPQHYQIRKSGIWTNIPQGGKPWGQPCPWRKLSLVPRRCTHRTCRKIFFSFPSEIRERSNVFCSVACHQACWYLSHTAGFNERVPIGNIADLARRYRDGESVRSLSDEVGLSATSLARKLFRVPGIQRRSGKEREKAKVICRCRHLEQLITRYKAGESIQTLQPESGLKTWQALRKLFAEQGISIRRSHNVHSWVSTEDLVARYEQGESIASLSRQTSLGPGAIRTRLLNAGVVFRAGSITREKELTFAVPVEREIAAELSHLDLRITPQKAVGPYNVDLALDDHSIALEVERYGAFGKRQIERTIRRTRFLLSKGWSVLFLVTYGRPVLFPDVLEPLFDLVEMPKRKRRNRYAVIGRSGYVLTTARTYLAGLERIPGF
jgi:very-short-patch-repair endonuclease/lambda repressor-like predicted transcriptional regulator